MSWRAVAPETAERLLIQLRALEWGWNPAELPEVLRRLGWSVVAEVAHAGVVADAGLGLGGQEAIFTYAGPWIEWLDVALTDNTRTDSRPARVFLHDAFADLVEVATRTFGEPSRRNHGDHPAVEWRDRRTALALVRGSVTVAVTVMSAARRDYWDLIEEEPWDG